jgi:hypothetical protein
MVFVRLDEITNSVLFICLYLDKNMKTVKVTSTTFRELFIVLDTAGALNCTDFVVPNCTELKSL